MASGATQPYTINDLQQMSTWWRMAYIIIVLTWHVCFVLLAPDAVKMSHLICVIVLNLSEL